MEIATKPLYRDKLELILFFVIGAGLLFHSSCATFDVAQKKPETVVSEEKALKPKVFKSKEYTVCRLDGRETYCCFGRKIFRRCRKIMGDRGP